MCVTQRRSRVPDEIVRRIKYRIMQIALFTRNLLACFLPIRSRVDSDFESPAPVPGRGMRPMRVIFSSLAASVYRA